MDCTLVSTEPTLETQNFIVPAGHGNIFLEAYIPIDKRSSLMGNPIPPAVYGTNAESCRCLLGQVARAA